MVSVVIGLVRVLGKRVRRLSKVWFEYRFGVYFLLGCLRLMGLDVDFIRT